MNRVNRKVTSRKKLADHDDDTFVPGTMEQRIAMAWPLTREIASLSPLHDVERRLQRHITRIHRRES